MTEPIPEKNIGFESAQTRLKKRYFSMVITGDDFICPKEDQEDEMMKWSDLDYCNTFALGEGCKYCSQCSPYQKQLGKI